MQEQVNQRDCRLAPNAAVIDKGTNLNNKCVRFNY
jgi:hypothetical protein